MPGRSVDPRFPARMVELMGERGLSYRALAAATFHAKSQLQRIGTGAQAPTPDLAARIDNALGAGGELVGYTRDPTHARILDAAGRDSSDLVHLLCAGQVDDAVHAAAVAADRLAIEYLTLPPGVALGQAVDLRRAAVAALPQARHRGEAADLLVAVGRLSGVLSYAALDLGDPATAAVHAAAAWHCGEAVDHSGLRAWARGTQSLIGRFVGDFPAALAHAQDGMRYAHDGASLARLLCGQAQSNANMSDGPAARRALGAAADALGVEHVPDPGLFGFTAAKLAYYSGSALIWLDQRGDALLAETESQRAIELWGAAPDELRPAGDEALAHVYQATARLQLREVEGAAAALRPILDLPEDRKLSWIKKRLGRIADMLADRPYRGDRAAVELTERIRAF